MQVGNYMDKMISNIIDEEYIKQFSDEIQDIWFTLENVKDPEIPNMSVIDMGILREVNVVDNTLEVIITPTYSGCPAIQVIESDVNLELQKKYSKVYDKIIVKSRLSPAWSTDWMPEASKYKLMEAKISPPIGNSSDNLFKILNHNPEIICPHCKSKDTIMQSFFGTTACKSLYKCNSCLMPFDYFKCH